MIQAIMCCPIKDASAFASGSQNPTGIPSTSSPQTFIHIPRHPLPTESSHYKAKQEHRKSFRSREENHIMSNKAPIFPIPEPQHFTDYGFDPQVDHFQVLLVETRQDFSVFSPP